MHMIMLHTPISHTFSSTRKIVFISKPFFHKLINIFQFKNFFINKFNSYFFMFIRHSHNMFFISRIRKHIMNYIPIFSSPNNMIFLSL